MSFLPDLRASVSSWCNHIVSPFPRYRLEAEMAEEMRALLDEQTARNVAAGMSPDDARATAPRQSGGVAQTQEQARDARVWVWLDQFAQDPRHDVRLERRNPGFTAAAVIVLARGSGANAGVFNLVQSLLFAPATYARPVEERRVVSQNRANPRQTHDSSYPAYREIRDANALLFGTLASASLVVGVGVSGNTPSCRRDRGQRQLLRRARRHPGAGTRLYARGGNARAGHRRRDYQLQFLKEPPLRSRAAELDAVDQYASLHRGRHHAGRFHRHDRVVFHGDLAAARRLRPGGGRHQPGRSE